MGSRSIDSDGECGAVHGDVAYEKHAGKQCRSALNATQLGAFYESAMRSPQGVVMTPSQCRAVCDDLGDACGAVGAIEPALNANPGLRNLSLILEASNITDLGAARLGRCLPGIVRDRLLLEDVNLHTLEDSSRRALAEFTRRLRVFRPISTRISGSVP
mgnify:CR=1 FL=1